MLKKSPFFDFLNRREGETFEEYLQNATEDEHYISWNQFVLANDYGDAKFEYHSIRNDCALFDVSPMRKVRIRGNGAGVFLDHLVTRPVSTADPMQGIYVAYCNEDGTLKDDSILYKFAQDDYLLMPSDMDHSEHFQALLSTLGVSDCSIEDCTESLAGMAIQGPMSATLLKNMGLQGIELLEPYQVKDFQLSEEYEGLTLSIARMGFTADLGYECWMDAKSTALFERCLSSAATTLDIALTGYGLTALEACRLEGGFIVAGWDCATEADPNPDFERSPYELGLGWLVNLHGADFIGKDALSQEKSIGGRFVKRCFTLSGDESPEEEQLLWSEQEGQVKQIGSINCSSWSWTLDCTIGNASILREYRELTEAWAMIRGQRFNVQLSRGALLNFDRSRQVPAPIVS